MVHLADKPSNCPDQLFYFVRFELSVLSQQSKRPVKVVVDAVNVLEDQAKSSFDLFVAAPNSEHFIGQLLIFQLSFLAFQQEICEAADYRANWKLGLPRPAETENRVLSLPSL
jgi:hypothetical protein